MTRPSRRLPTADQILDHAEQALRKASSALSDARDWLQSDWEPPSTALTEDQADRRTRLRAATAKAKAAIEEGLHG